jgi:hypothetical protein
MGGGMGGGGMGGGGGGGGSRPGDWICGSCSNNNFAWRTECKRCNAPGGNGGGGMGNKRGLDGEEHGDRKTMRNM